MSLPVIQTEIRRFLQSTDPEVLCIKGKWGVGKTYAWKRHLAEAERAGRLGFKRYSYVSLFGLNSLDDLRFSIFENTVTGSHVASGPDARSFADLFSKGTDLSRKLRPVLDTALAAINRKGVGETLFRTAFLTVRNQMICIDDLERAGSGLSTRDVLGLASFLKEERRCSVVLLLNDEKMDAVARKEFNSQLEKVADVALTFDLSSSEAINIALAADGPLVSRLRPCLMELGITNIRVIKKIDRLATKLVELLHGFDDRILDQSINTLVLAAWSVQQPDTAPPLEFLRTYNRISIAVRAEREEIDADTARWRNAIETYPFNGTDDFDAVILDGAAAGYFDESRLKETGQKIQTLSRRNSRDNSFSRAWEELYHGSLSTEDWEFLDALYLSAINEAKAIDPLNINSAIRLLRECGRGHQADEVIEKYLAARSEEGPAFFNVDNHHFSNDTPIDEAFREAFARQREIYVDLRDPLDVLRSMGERRGGDEADIALMAKQSADSFEQMFESLRGITLRRSIEVLMSYGNSRYDGEGAILSAATEALRRIAAKSPLRARKVKRFGVSIDVPPS